MTTAVDTISIVASSILSSALVSAVVQILLKQHVQTGLALLRHELDIEKEARQEDRRRASEQLKTQFSWLFVERAKAMNEIYACVNETERAIRNCIPPLAGWGLAADRASEARDPAVFKKRVHHAMEVGERFESALARSNLLFSDDLAGKLAKLFYAYESVFFELDEGSPNEPLIIAISKREHEAREILRQIEREFRLLYGTLDGSVERSAEYEVSGQWAARYQQRGRTLTMGTLWFRLGMRKRGINQRVGGFSWKVAWSWLRRPRELRSRFLIQIPVQRRSLTMSIPSSLGLKWPAGRFSVHLTPWPVNDKQIAFWSDRDGTGELYLMNTDGSSVSHMTNGPGFDFEPAFSPMSREVVFSSQRDGKNFQIYIVNVDSKVVRRLIRSCAGLEMNSRVIIRSRLELSMTTRKQSRDFLGRPGTWDPGTRCPKHIAIVMAIHTSPQPHPAAAHIALLPCNK
jgi:hypothetical protein